VAQIAGAFDPTAPWALSEQVSIRDEEFGALAYHHGNRRLIFLKSRQLVAIVRSLGSHASAREAVAAAVSANECDAYERALSSLASAEVLRAG
jgi:putative mycofactocin binding protein MftB